MLSACAFGDTASDGGMPIHRSRGGERRGVGGGTTPVSSKNSLHDRLYASRLQTAEEQSPTYHANEALHPVAQRGGVPRKVEAAKCWTRARKARGPGRRRAANGTRGQVAARCEQHGDSGGLDSPGRSRGQEIKESRKVYALPGATVR